MTHLLPLTPFLVCSSLRTPCDTRVFLKKVFRVSQKQAVQEGGSWRRSAVAKKQEICLKINHKVELQSSGLPTLLQTPCDAAQIPLLQIFARLGFPARNEAFT